MEEEVVSDKAWENLSVRPKEMTLGAQPPNAIEAELSPKDLPVYNSLPHMEESQ